MLLPTSLSSVNFTIQIRYTLGSGVLGALAKAVDKARTSRTLACIPERGRMGTDAEALVRMKKGEQCKLQCSKAWCFPAAGKPTEADHRNMGWEMPIPMAKPLNLPVLTSLPAASFKVLS